MFNSETSVKLSRYSGILQKAHEEIRGIEKAGKDVSCLTFKERAGACEALGILAYINGGLRCLEEITEGIKGESIPGMRYAADLFTAAMNSRGISVFLPEQRKKLNKLVVDLHDYIIGRFPQRAINS